MKHFKNIKLCVLICFFFFLLYSVLSVVRHNHFGSFGFDLGITDQIVWNYSQFRLPINTIYQHPFTSTFTDHIEFIYIVIAPLYWIFSDVRLLLVLQAGIVCLSGIPVYLFAKEKKVSHSVCIALLVSYLMFYGIQNALWFDVHSLTLASGILPWFLYFLDKNQTKRAGFFFFLAIICKEDIALFTFLISFIYFVTTRRKTNLIFMLLSIVYLGVIFLIYFPYFTEDGYRFKNPNGMFADMKIEYFFDTSEKQKIIFSSLGSFGFLSVFSPLYLLLFGFDLFHYFILGHTVPTAQTFFMHYRVTLALFMVWPTIITIQKYKKYLNNNIIALYLVICALFFQYTLHLPLSYLTKSWFWQRPVAVLEIQNVLQFLPKNTSVASQNNITSHISQRKEVFTVWPEKKGFITNSPCGKAQCDWLRWAGRPEYLLVAIDSMWDIRHYLLQEKEYSEALSNLEKTKNISVYKKSGRAVLYKVNNKFYDL